MQIKALFSAQEKQHFSDVYGIFVANDIIIILMEVVYDRAQVLMGRKFVVVFAMVVAS